MQTIKCDCCRKVKRESKDLGKDKWMRLSVNTCNICEIFYLCDKCSPELLTHIKKYLKNR